MTTLQQALDYLTTLAREHGADLLNTIELVSGGASLTVHWTPTVGEGLPRECTLLFSGEPDQMSCAFVVIPEHWLHCVEEGMSFEDCDSAARRVVTEWEAVVSYLVAAPAKGVVS